MSWKATLQHVVARLTTEVEYIFDIEAIEEALWLTWLISDLGYLQDTIVVYCDNLSIIPLNKNPQNHERINHVYVKYHFIWEVAENGLVMLKDGIGKIM